MAGTNTETEVNSNKQIIVNGDVIGTPISGGYASDSKTETIILYGKAEKNSGMTLKQAVVSFGKLGIGITEKEITDAIPKTMANVLNDIRVILKQAYYYKTSKVLTTEEKTELEAAQKKVSDSSTAATKKTAQTALDEVLAKFGVVVQYAIWIELDIVNLIPKDFIVDVDSVSLRFWSSNTPPKILEEMEITKMQELIDSATKKIAPAAAS